MLLELAGYPLRPTRQPGESLAGFVSRHFGTNGHWMPEALHHAITTLYRSESAVRREEAWALIRRLTGQDSTEDRRLWLDQRFSLPEAGPKRKGRSWQRAILSPIRVCPRCLAEQGVHLALWELPLVSICPLHDCLLLQHCQCGRGLTWPSMGPDWTCRCGQSLTTLVSPPASPALGRLTRLVAETSGLHTPSWAPDVERRVATHLRQTYALVFWLQELLQCIHEVSRGHATHERTTDERLGRLLKDWPDGLECRLLRLLRIRHHRERGNVFLLLDDKHPTRRLLDYLADAGSQTDLPAGAYLVAHRVLAHFASPIGEARVLVFNPALSIEERQARLGLLMRWWSSLRPWIEVSDTLPQVAISPTLYFESLDAQFRVLLLNVLVGAATAQVSPEHFRRFAQAWPPGRPLPADCGHDVFIQAFDAQLRTVSSAHLQYLCELACHAAGVTRAAV